MAHPGEVRCTRTGPDVMPDPSGHARGHIHGHRSDIDAATHLGADADAERDGTGTSDSDRPDARKHDTE